MAIYAEYIVDQREWAKIRVVGNDSERFLQGLCTNDLSALGVGAFCRASILNQKGRVLSVVDVVRVEGAFHLFCEPVLGEKTAQILQRYQMMDEVAFSEIEEPMYRRWGAPESVWDAPPILGALPAPAASATEVEIRRVEAGLPKYGADVDEGNFPFESILENAIDYKKGCYIGQEPVYRVYAKGSPAKFLRTLEIRCDEKVPVGAAVVAGEKKVGTITSSALSPTRGSLALAYIKKAAWDPGTEVQVEGHTAVVQRSPNTKIPED